MSNLLLLETVVNSGFVYLKTTNIFQYNYQKAGKFVNVQHIVLILFTWLNERITTT